MPIINKKQIYNQFIVRMIHNLKPLGFIEYVKLQENAFIVLSDSGTLTEESAMRHFPAVLIRASTERPEGVEAGGIVVSGIDKTVSY